MLGNGNADKPLATVVPAGPSDNKSHEMRSNWEFLIHQGCVQQSGKSKLDSQHCCMWLFSPASILTQWLECFRLLLGVG